MWPCGEDPWESNELWSSIANDGSRAEQGSPLGWAGVGAAEGPPEAWGWPDPPPEWWWGMAAMGSPMRSDGPAVPTPGSPLSLEDA